MPAPSEGEAVSTVTEPTWRAALASSVSTHRRVAAYTLPQALNARMLHLGERKESLTPAERDELLALVAFTQDRSIEKLDAELAVRKLTAVCPDLGVLS
jgi:hypothetical protein